MVYLQAEIPSCPYRYDYNRRTQRGNTQIKRHEKSNIQSRNIPPYFPIDIEKNLVQNISDGPLGKRTNIGVEKINNERGLPRVEGTIIS